MKVYSNKIKLPITEKISRHIVTIPIHPNLSNKNIEKVIQTINKNTSKLYDSFTNFIIF